MPNIPSYEFRDPTARPLTIAGATRTSSGVVTLDAVNAPGDWVALNYQNGFHDTGTGVPPNVNFIFGLGQSRLAGDTVQLQGCPAAPDGGTGGASVLAILPAAQRPSVIRPLTAIYLPGGLGGTAVAFTLVVDDKLGTESGFPGAIVVAPNLPNVNGTLIPLNGLWFVL